MSNYLYHYMSLETLKIILKDRTFRFRNLSLMDDLREGDTSDLENLKRFTYVSSWTESSIDTKAFWDYSSEDNGVRIRMKKNPFKISIKLDDDLRFFLYSTGLKMYFDDPVLTGFHFKPGPPKLLKVIYTDDEKLLEPNVVHRGLNHHFSIMDKDIGVYKGKGWREQYEWRYRLQCSPTKLMIKFVDGQIDKEEFFEELNKTSSMEYIDLPLKDDAFDDFEILVSPFTDEKGRKELMDIVDYYVPHAVVKDSELNIRKK